jgi:low affinity Fe/Cu permease
MSSGGKGGFDRFASWAARAFGHALAFSLAVFVTVVWAVSGPIFHYSDTWQLVINTGTTVLTFLMVFVVQNTLNRDSAALHVKLDELIRVTNEARDAFVGAEHLSGHELDRIRDDLEEHTSGNHRNPDRSNR